VYRVYVCNGAVGFCTVFVYSCGVRDCVIIVLIEQLSSLGQILY